MNNKNQFKSIEHKLMLIISVSMSFFLILAVTLTFNYYYSKQLENAANVQKQLVRTVQAQVSVGLYAVNEYILNDIMDGLLVSSYIDGVAIHSNQRLIVEKHKQHAKNNSKSFYPIFSPIDNKERIGEIIIVQNDNLIDNESFQDGLVSTSLMLLQLIVVMILFIIVYRILLGRPLKNLIEQITNLSEVGETSLRLNCNKNNSQDEIGLLTKHTNSLLDVKEKAIDVAQQATKSKSDFLANMSHEIRTPLNAIIGMGYLVLQGELSGKQRKYLKTMDSSARLLLSLINDILDFSKTESGKMELENIRFKLDDVLDNLNKVVGIKAQEKNIQITFSYSKDIPNYLNGDPLRLGQILINLVNNAIKFTDQGSIIIQIKKLSQQENSFTLQFDVKDTGIGMDKEQQQKLFQSFSQVDSSMTRKFGGTGLGLAISKQLTELMQGDIWVESEAGKGSTFSFTASFGLSEQHESDSLEPSAQTDESTNFFWPEARILLVEDNDVNQQVATATLADTQVKIDTANDGLEAVEQIKYEKYDLILMDIQMPKMDGLEATEIIRQQFSYKQLPIIAMTAHAMHQDREKFLSVGMNDYISKPFEVDDLFKTIDKWLPSSKKINSKEDYLEEHTTQINKFQTLLDHKFDTVNLQKLLPRLKYDGQLLFSLISSFHSRNVVTLPEMSSHINNGNMEQAKDIAHSIKGTSGNLYLDEIYPLSIKLDQACLDNDSQTCLDLLQQLEQAFTRLDQTRNELKELLKNDIDNNNKPVQINDDELQELLLNLEKLINSNNMQAISDTKKLNSLLTGSDISPHIEQELEQLNQHLSQLDYDNALISIHKIIELVR